MAEDVAAAVRLAGFGRFCAQPGHLGLWKAEDAKSPARGFGVDVRGCRSC